MNINEALDKYIQKLNEDIQAVKNRYPNIDNKVFDKLIRLDPTFVEGRDSVGTYGKWILTLYTKGKLIEEEFNRVQVLLNTFIEKRRSFDNKDINQFKSLDALQTALDTVVEKPLSARQQDRQNEKKRDSLNYSSPDIEFIGETDKWAVYVPHSYKASMFLGKGTEWCTASEHSDANYKGYKEDAGGDYIVFINKQNPAEKYQWHGPSYQFKDAYDNQVPFEERLKILRELGPELEAIINQRIDRDQAKARDFKAWASNNAPDELKTVCRICIPEENLYYCGPATITPKLLKFIDNPGCLFSSFRVTRFTGETPAHKILDVLEALYSKYELYNKSDEELGDSEEEIELSHKVLDAIENMEIYVAGTPKATFADFDPSIKRDFEA